MTELCDKTSYSSLAGQETNWLPMDTEELFLENLKKRKTELERYGWIDRKFTYKFNNHGFRSDEFSDQEGICFLGCSHTVGIGIPFEYTWTKLVSNYYNLKCYNLGIGGSSHDSMFRIAYNYLSKLNTKIVVILSTHINRLEIFDHHDNIINLCGSGSASRKYRRFYDSWMSNVTNMESNKMKNLLAIKMICHDLNLKFIHSDIDDMGYVDLARDLSHRGIQTNLDFSRTIISKIETIN